MTKYVGLDVGSGTAKIAVLDENKNLLFWRYKRTHGQPIETAEKLLSEVEEKFNNDLSGITCTGTAGKTISQILNCAFVNEVMAHAKAATFFYPQVKTIIDIGGEDSKLIFITHERGVPEIDDFALNTLCAAGTGSFLEQQAARLGYTIEEFSQLALKAKNIPRIAGRCTVFAKSDMIHLQQAAVPDCEIIAGLCFAIIRNLKSNLAKGREVLPPLIFQGGVAANLGVRRAVKEVFGLKDDELIIPEHFKIMGAIGAAIYGLEGKATSEYKSSELLRIYLKNRNYNPDRHPVLTPFESLHLSEKFAQKIEKKRWAIKIENDLEIYIGIDVGSVSTKLVAIDQNANLISKVYMLHQGKPLESIKKGLLELKSKLPCKVKVKGVGSTGSGRYLIGDFVGADVIRNEITAQAYGALFLDPEVDTIFEIGGQDSKYIYLDKGTISDFTMNKACAAGTGSFLQEQAVKLEIPIEKFGDIALKSQAPLKLGERCTVFMQSDLLHYQQQGLPKEDLIAGLCYAIVYNYLNKVVEGRKIGKKIFFQGAVAFNKGVVAAFEKVLGKPVIVPPHHEVTGAIGVALLAKEETQGKTRFKGFDLSQVRYSIKTFECKGCPNQCEIHQVSIEGSKPYYYGGRCEKYEVDYRKPPENIPNLTLEREEKLLSYVKTAKDVYEEDKIIGIPRILQFYEWLPLFATFFQELGYKVILSPPTSKQIIKTGCELAPAEPCFPIKIALGHIKALLDAGIKKIFLPQITDLPPEHPFFKIGKVCPYVQSIPWISPASIKFDKYKVKLINPVLHLGRPKFILIEEIKNLAKQLNIPVSKAKQAWKKGERAQKEFHNWLKERGKKILQEFKDQIILVIVGRPYNAFDPGANLGLHYKIRKLGVIGLPVDMLSLDEFKDFEILEDLKNMYWEYGQRFLLAAHIIKKTPNLFPIFFTNFSCGPDSFIKHFFEEELKDKPFLELEVDEHSAEAGMVTRLEAFLDSIKNKVGISYEYQKPKIEIKAKPTDGRTIYIPYMCDHARVLAAAFRACGVKAEVLPEPDEQSLELGRKYTSGKECYPTVLTTGDLIKLINSPDFNPEKSVFFMPDSGGPCRFGQYNQFHKKLLRDLNIKMPVYSLQQDMQFYEDLDLLGKNFMKIAWRGIIAVDILDKFLRKIRPYALNKKEVENLYQESLLKIERTIEEQGDLVETLLDIKKAFSKIDIKQEEKPVVGIVGEIYVRNNRFANENLYRFLEDLGLEVLLPPVSEWIHFINYTSKNWAKKLGYLKTVLRYIIESHFLKWEEKRFISLVKDLLESAEEPEIEDLMKLTQKYIDVQYEGGEVLLSVGKSVEYLNNGIFGIINVIPFACMPGNVVTAILKRIKETERKRIPTLTVSCDGQKSLGTKMRIEAFVEQVKEYFYSKKQKN